MQYNKNGAPIMPTSAVAVAAAMVAVVAEQPVGYHSDSSFLRDKKYDSTGQKVAASTGCIQGALLGKLGYFELPGAENVYSGDYTTVMLALGQGAENGEYEGVDIDSLSPEQHRLLDALAMAQAANDARLPWSAALEAFERVMAGERVSTVRTAVVLAQNGLKTLRDRRAWQRRNEQVAQTCACGCGAVMEKAPEFAPSWYSPIFQKAVDAEMASMKKFVELANKPIEQTELKYVSFPVVGSKNPVSAFADLATV